MKPIALHLSRLSISEKVKLTRGSVTSMTGNPAFKTPAVSLKTMSAAADTLEAADAQADADHKTWLASEAAKRAAESELDTHLTNQGHYVDMQAAGDEAVQRSSGLPAGKDPTHTTTAPAAPTGLGATHGDNDGEVDLHWHRVIGAKSYQIATGPDGVAGPWTIVAGCPKSSFTLTGIVKSCWIRVAAIGANGTSPWSSPVHYAAPGA